MSWHQDVEYAAQVAAYNEERGNTKNNLSSASPWLSCFEGLYPEVSLDDPCRDLKAHTFKTITELTDVEGVDAMVGPCAPPSLSDAGPVVDTPSCSRQQLSPLQAYLLKCITSKSMDVSRTVLEVSNEGCDDVFDSLRISHAARKYVTLGSKSLAVSLSSSPSVVSIQAPIGDRDAIHRAIRETSSCGYETILFALSTNGGTARASVSVPALLFTITSCLSKNNSSGAYLFIEDGSTTTTGNNDLHFTCDILSQAAYFGLNYYVVDKGVMTTTANTPVDATTTTVSTPIMVVKLTHRMDMAGPSMACSIPLNQHIEDRQRFGVPTRDTDESDEEFKQRQTTYAQAKREFQRKFLLTHSHPVVPPTADALTTDLTNYYPVFDVVVQGMGLVEALLVVALARSGKRVLHVCGDDHYGSAFASTDLFSFHRDYVLDITGTTTTTSTPSNRGALQSIKMYEDKVFATTATPAGHAAEGDDATAPPAPSHVVVTDREKRQFIIDLFPMFHFSRSDLFNLLVDSRVSPSMDMMLVDRVLLLTSGKKPPGNDAAATPGNKAGEAQQPAKLTARERLAKLRQKETATTKTTSVSVDTPEGAPTSVSAPAPSSVVLSTTPSTSLLSVEPIPFSRADVFRQQSSTATSSSATTSTLGKLAAAAATASMGLLEMRKLMKFIRDLERYMSEQGGFGGEDCDSGDEDALQARIEESKASTRAEDYDDASKLPWQRSSQDPHEEIGAFLERVYGLAEHTRQLLLLGGTISNKQPSTGSSTTVTHAINSLALAFSSVGRFEGLATPFLVPLYGTGELVQTLCTRSASWLSTTILRRCIKRISPPTYTPDNTTGTGMTTVELSNGERVLTRAVVVPNGLLPTTAPQQHQPKYHRAVLVLSSPFISWKQLETRCNDGLSHVDDADQRAQAEQVRNSALYPTSVSVLPVNGGGKVLIYQLGMSSEHTPYAFQKAENRDEGSVPCLLHFLVDASTTTRNEFDAAVDSCIIEGIVSVDRPIGISKESILYRVHFTLDNEASVRCGGGDSEGYCVVDRNKDGTTATSPPSILSIPTMFNGTEDISSSSITTTPVPPGVVTPTIHTPNPAMCILDDGWYAHTAERAYHSVQQYLLAASHTQSEPKSSSVAPPVDVVNISGGTVLLQHSYMPFFEEFPDPGDRWYAGYDPSEKKPTQLRGDGEEEEVDDLMEGVDTENGLGYEDRTLQLLRQQQQNRD